MSSLTELLEREARRRGLLASGEAVDAGIAFALIRDMPCRRASARRPESIIEEWRGACSGKHCALDGIFREMGLDSRVIMCTHRFTRDNTGHFPDDLRSLVAKEAAPDVHTCIRLDAGDGWMTVDATWPSSAEPLGIPVNREFIPGRDMTIAPGRDMTIACDVIDAHEVPSGCDPQEFRERLIAEFCGASGQVRDHFIQGLSRWPGEAT